MNLIMQPVHTASNTTLVTSSNLVVPMRCITRTRVYIMGEQARQVERTPFSELSTRLPLI